MLADLERLAHRALPEEAAKALVVEAAEHLEASIQARLELHDSPAMAEREAVAAFGKVETLVRREAALRRGRWYGPSLAWMTVLGACWLPTALLGTQSGTPAFLAAAAAFLVAAVFFMRAAEAKRPWRPILRSLAAFWLLSTGLLAAFCGPYGSRLAGRGMLASNVSFYAGHAEARIRREAKYARLGWPSAELRQSTERDRRRFEMLSNDARLASTAVDLSLSARWATNATLVFAAYLLLCGAIGALCEWSTAKGSRWSRWDSWRLE